MFGFCSSLKNLNISKFNTSNVLYMNNMFNLCSSLVKLDISSFDNTKTKSTQLMFGLCTALKEIKITKFNIKSGNTYTGCSNNLKIINEK